MYIQRELEQRFLNVQNIHPVTALVGPRQAGKTTMLKQLAKQYNYSYVLFDDPDARELFDEDIIKFKMQYIDGYDLAILDEVQYCEDAGRKLKFLADTGSKIWITSSSEVILRAEILSYLVGRVGVLHLYPFSIVEFLSAKKQRATTAGILKRMVWEHATYGGFPRVVLMSETDMKKEILRNLHETIILKDAVHTFSIDNARAIEKLSLYLAHNTGQIVSYTTLMNDLGISFQTLKKYLDALIRSNLIIEVPPFFTNKTKEISKQPKIYYVDTGLRNSVVGEFPNKMTGPLFENYVLSELIKMGFKPKYWRTKSRSEVDFIVELGEKIVPVEVKLRAAVGKVERSLRSFMERYSPEFAVVVSYDGEKGEREVSGRKVLFTDIMGLREVLLL